MVETMEIRRVVTGNDEQGRSRVVSDGPAPKHWSSQFQTGTSFTDIWRIETHPANLSAEETTVGAAWHFEPPELGATVRVVHSTAKPDDYDPNNDTNIVSEHPPRMTEGGTWERGGQNLYRTRIHKSATLDYGILLSGERTLILDDGEYILSPGDIVIQIGSWHAWSNENQGSRMAFIMMGAQFEPEERA
jgi:hypothetical protein